jgi:hypothetical protein
MSNSFPEFLARFHSGDDAAAQELGVPHRLDRMQRESV